MSGDTNIEWADATWNPTIGCSRVSQGCVNCYAEKQASRIARMQPSSPYLHVIREDAHGDPQWTGKVMLLPERLAWPLRKRKPLRIFVNSMSDLFHESLSNEEIAAVFGVMAAAPQHTFQVLTKRAKRMREWFAWLGEHGGLGPFIRSIRVDGDRTIPNLFDAVARTMVVHGKTVRARNDPWMQVFNAAAVCGAGPLPNVWLGVSVEDQATADERIPHLLETPAAVRFVSYEPALGLIRHMPGLFKGHCPTHDGPGYFCHGPCPDDQRIDWVIVGGESGPGARPFDIQWARAVVRQCKEAGTAAFVKQLGSKPEGLAHRNGLKHPKGGGMDEFPEDLRVREFPETR